jgi:predicted adenylyl cyclase CyaB
MAIESEAKFEIQPESLTGVRYQLIARGARQVSRPLAEENWLLDFVDGRLRSSGCTLRIRSYGSQSLLTLKGPVQTDPKLKMREETEILVDDGTALHHIMLQMGLTVWFQYAKTREIFELSDEAGTLQVSLDETVVGTFVELEGKPEAIYRVAAEFGWTDFITKSYVELFMERGL